MVTPRSEDRAWQFHGNTLGLATLIPGLSTASIQGPDALDAVASGGGRRDPGIVPGYLSIVRYWENGVALPEICMPYVSLQAYC